VKYVDASAVLRILFSESGSKVPLAGNDRVVSSQLVEIEAFRAVDRERLLGNLDDAETASKRKELAEPLEFWTHDDRQATAALSRGLTVRGT